MKPVFVILYTPGPAWIAGQGIAAQPLQEHVAYMHELARAGKLVMAGPFADNTGGLAILDVAEASEAESVLAHDPAVMTHVLAGTPHLWQTLIQDRSSMAG